MGAPFKYQSTEKCRFMGKELRENAPATRGSEEAGFTQFLTHKSTLLSTTHPSKTTANSWNYFMSTLV